MDNRFIAEQERGSQQIDIGIWACLFTKKWQPKLSFTSTVVIFFVLGIVFAAFSIFMYFLHMRVSEYGIYKYDIKCNSKLGK
jgi:hypothetical protein